MKKTILALAILNLLLIPIDGSAAEQQLCGHPQSEITSGVNYLRQKISCIDGNLTKCAAYAGTGLATAASVAALAGKNAGRLAGRLIRPKIPTTCFLAPKSASLWFIDAAYADGGCQMSNELGSLLGQLKADIGSARKELNVTPEESAAMLARFAETQDPSFAKAYEILKGCIAAAGLKTDALNECPTKSYYEAKGRSVPKRDYSTGLLEASEKERAEVTAFSAYQRVKEIETGKHIWPSLTIRDPAENYVSIAARTYLKAFPAFSHQESPKAKYAILTQALDRLKHVRTPQELKQVLTQLKAVAPFVAKTMPYIDESLAILGTISGDIFSAAQSKTLAVLAEKFGLKFLTGAGLRGAAMIAGSAVSTAAFAADGTMSGRQGAAACMDTVTGQNPYMNFGDGCSLKPQMNSALINKLLQDDAALEKNLQGKIGNPLCSAILAYAKERGEMKLTCMGANFSLNFKEMGESASVRGLTAPGGYTLNYYRGLNPFGRQYQILNDGIAGNFNPAQKADDYRIGLLTNDFARARACCAQNDASACQYYDSSSREKNSEKPKAIH